MPPFLQRRLETLSVKTLILSLVLICLVPAFIGQSYLIYKEFQAGREQLEKSALQEVRQLMELIDVQLEKMVLIAQSLASSNYLSNKNYFAFYRLAEQVVDQNSLITNVTLTDIYGHQLLNTFAKFGDPLPLIGSLDLVRHVSLTGKPAISNLYVGTVTNKHRISIFVPVFSGGEAVGVLAVGIDASIIYKLLAQAHLPEKWNSAVQDGNGRLIARLIDNDKFVGRNVSATFMHRIETSAEGVYENISLSGVPSIIAFTHSRISSWTASASVAKVVLEDRLLKRIFFLALSTAALLLISAFFSLLLGGWISRSILSLRSKSIALASNKELQQLDPGFLEANQVSKALDKTSWELKERQEALIQANQLLEGRVEERTDELNKRNDELDDLYNHAPCGYFSIDPQGIILKMNQTLLDWLGYSREGVVGKMHLTDFYSDGSKAKFEASFKQFKADGYIQNKEVKLICKNQEILIVNMSATMVVDEAGQMIMSNSVAYDITEKKKLEAQIEFMAYSDSLTGLPNRRLLMDRLDVATMSSERSHCHGVLLAIDIDNLKPLNDSYGHSAGDALLIEVGRRLKSCVREVDTAARIGGDEFFVLISGLDVGEARSIEEAKLIAEKIRLSLSRPYQITILNSEGRQEMIEYICTASIGGSIFLGKNKIPELIIKTADEAMYQAKQFGRNQVQFI